MSSSFVTFSRRLTLLPHSMGCSNSGPPDFKVFVTRFSSVCLHFTCQARFPLPLVASVMATKLGHAALELLLNLTGKVSNPRRKTNTNIDSRLTVAAVSRRLTEIGQLILFLIFRFVSFGSVTPSKYSMASITVFFTAQKVLRSFSSCFNGS